jgi:hypothetical protein
MSGSHKRAWADAQSRCPFGPLLTPAEILEDSPPPPYDSVAASHLLAMAGYVSHFLTQPHPRLGRSGAVCPFAARGLAEQTIRLTAFMEPECTEQAVIAGMLQLRDRMETEVDAGPNRAVVAVFPGLAEPEGAAIIERIQKAMKLSFVKRGLMLGEFYPSCTRGGLWNEDFKALQAPAICLAVRNMTLYDAPFMLDRKVYADAFVGQFGEAGAERILKARQSLGDRGRAAGAAAGARPAP